MDLKSIISIGFILQRVYNIVNIVERDNISGTDIFNMFHHRYLLPSFAKTKNEEKSLFLALPLKNSTIVEE